MASTSEIPETENKMPTARDIRELNRTLNKSMACFSQLANQQNIEEISELYEEMTTTYNNLTESINCFMSSLDQTKNAAQIEDYTERLEVIDTQYSMVKMSYSKAIKEHSLLKKDLEQTSKKNTVPSIASKRTKSRSVISRHSLISNRDLTPLQKMMVAESEVKMAKIEVEKKMVMAELTRQLATTGSSSNNDDKASREVNVIQNSDVEIVQKLPFQKERPHGGSYHDENNPCSSNPQSAQPLYRSSKSMLNEVGQINVPTGPTAYQSFGDQYLAGKVLIESGAKVAFNGDSRNYIAFRQGMERVMMMYGDQYGLIYDVLQSRCTGKAAEAVRNCDRIKDPKLAVETALDKLERFFGSDVSIIESHIAHITRNETVRWTVDAFQSLLNELEDVYSLFLGSDKVAMLNSPGVVKGVIARLPKRTRDRLAEILCEKDLHMPSFNVLLQFVGKQLDLVSHPVMRLEMSERPKKSDKNDVANSCKRVNHDVVKSYNFENSKVRTYTNRVNAFVCPVIGCKDENNHSLWKCAKYAQLEYRDKWSIAKKQGCCYKCLNTGHPASNCKSRYSCYLCKADTHHYLLCDKDKGCRGRENKAESNPRNKTELNAEATEFKKREIDKVRSHNALIDVERKLLPVLPVMVKSDHTGQSALVNCLLDSGCDSTLATRHLAQLLGLNEEEYDAADVIMATSNNETKEKAFKIDVEVGCCNSDKFFSLKNVICMNKIGKHNNPIGDLKVNLAEHTHLRNIALPSLQDKSIDLIIGCDHELMFDVLEIRRNSSSRLTAKLSPLGWFLVGCANMCGESDDADVTACVDSSCESIHNHHACLLNNDGVQSSESAFVCSGDVESCELLHAEMKQLFYADFETLAEDEENAPSINDARCTDNYNQSVTMMNGRYFCDLPLKTVDAKLPNNESQARARLTQQLRILKRDDSAKQFYENTIQKLVDTDKLEPVDLKTESEPGRTNYIPHFVTKQNKKRLVYDASAKFEGVSLNSMLLQGEDCVPNLWNILLRFRRFSVAFSCDIQEMFLQCGVNEKHRDLLRILWVENHDVDGQIVGYRFKRLPYGLNCSMSMANYCLKKTADENLINAADETVNLVHNSFYVDDGLISCGNVNAGRATVNELVPLLRSGGFELKKFMSNRPEILQDLDPSRLLPEATAKDFDDVQSSCTVLGLHWNAVSDTISPKVKIKERPLTKRGLWATVAQIFDPIGICAPYLLTGRRILQEAAETVSSWDEPLPTELAKRWNRYVKNLHHLEKLVLPRCYWKDKVETWELHTFCDSSERGYGCVTYLRMISQEECKVAFVIGKAKVIPKDNTFSVPRLELIAALLGARIHDQVKRAIELPLAECYLYSDSTIVLNWLHVEDKRLKKFVVRKIAEIKRLCGNDEWLHIGTDCNPADMCSRGVNPKKADPECMYFTGPGFLRERNVTVMSYEVRNGDVDVTELSDVDHCDCEDGEVKVRCNEVNVVNNVIAESDVDEGGKTDAKRVYVDVPDYIWYLTKRYSDYFKCLKMIAYRYRYVVLKLQKLGFKTDLTIENGCLKQHELNRAELDMVRISQESYFGRDVLKMLSSNEFSSVLSRSSKSVRSKLLEIKNLLPFYDYNDCVLRVGGRIVKSNLPVENIHQYILPKTCFVTDMLVKYYHVESHHFGANFVISQMLSKFWVCGGISTVRKYVRDCQYCNIRRERCCDQVMGNLPACRVNVPKFPFEHAGVDLFGPILIKVGRSVVKRWGVLFIRMASRACHIDIVPDLSTDAFLQCFVRFTARRGLYCRFLYSDQGTNFKGCDAELKRLMKRSTLKEMNNTDLPLIPDAVNRDRIAQCLSRKGVDVQWRFNVPKNPHAGGSWERGIRSIKYVYAAMLHNGLIGVPALKSRHPTEYELLTIMCEIEAVLNCRPITKLSSDVEDWRALTPMAILTGNLHPDSPTHEFNKSDKFRCNYKYVVAVAEEFWSRWIRMYLPWLQIRHRWSDVKPNVKVGDLVLVLEAQTEGRRDYPKAIIENVFPDEHGNVRSVKVCMADGREFDRDIRSVVHLEGFQEDADVGGLDSE